MVRPALDLRLLPCAAAHWPRHHPAPTPCLSTHGLPAMCAQELPAWLAPTSSLLLSSCQSTTGPQP